MGCIKLEHIENPSPLKVVPGKNLFFPKSSAGAYRYGFQGQEVDNEWLSGAVAFKYRIHDARLGRFLSVDPLSDSYPELSVYAFSGNQVIHTTELEGAEPLDYLGLGDHKGIIHSTSETNWHYESGAYNGLVDGTYIVLSMMGLNLLDNYIADLMDDDVDNVNASAQLVGDILGSTTTGGRMKGPGMSTKSVGSKLPNANKLNQNKGTLNQNKGSLKSQNKTSNAQGTNSTKPATKTVNAKEVETPNNSKPKQQKTSSGVTQKGGGKNDGFSSFDDIAKKSSEFNRTKGGSKSNFQGSENVAKVYQDLLSNGWVAETTKNGNKTLTKGNETILLRKSKSGDYKKLDTFTNTSTGQSILFE